MEKVVFLTGATGFVGGNLVIRLLKDPLIFKIFLLIRATSHADAERRLYEHPLKLMYKGWMRVIPGSRKVFIDIAPVDYVVNIFDIWI